MPLDDLLRDGEGAGCVDRNYGEGQGESTGVRRLIGLDRPKQRSWFRRRKEERRNTLEPAAALERAKRETNDPQA